MLENYAAFAGYVFVCVDHIRSLEEIVSGNIVCKYLNLFIILNVFHRIPLWQFFHFCLEG